MTNQGFFIPRLNFPKMWSIRAMPKLNRLRFFHTWLALGYGLILLVIYLSLTPAPPSIPIENGDKLGHGMAYATLMVWFAWLYPSSPHSLDLCGGIRGARHRSGVRPGSY